MFPILTPAMFPILTPEMLAASSPTILQPHQQRVIDEKRKLDEDRAKLVAFMSTPTYAGLDPAEGVRLARQYNHMTDYSLVLGERIAAFA